MPQNGLDEYNEFATVSQIGAFEPFNWALTIPEFEGSFRNSIDFGSSMIRWEV